MRKYLLTIVVFTLAFSVFLISALSSSRSRIFAAVVSTPTPSSLPVVVVDYSLPFTGKILPDNPLWSLKVGRDWVWYSITFKPLKKAELALLFADKRLSASKLLFEAKKPDIAVSTLTKAEKYLETAARQEEVARKKGEDTSLFLEKLAKASLKHRQVIEYELLPIAPEDAKPEMILTENYSKTIYKNSSEVLITKGILPPKDPFNGQ